MKIYSIVRIGNEYVVRVGEKSIMKIGSRRQAARLVTEAAELLEMQASLRIPLQAHDEQSMARDDEDHI
ncbi:MAG TPA: hypothetical protein VKB08_01545 [Bradyrhizobium sp.]|nr:hypothetical protein [Bradyrhizobium sp.]